MTIFLYKNFIIKQIFKIQLQFWKRLIESNKEIESAVDHYIMNLKKDFEGKVGEEFEEEIIMEKFIPQIYISIPTYMPDFELVKIANLSPKEKRYDELDILIYSEDNEIKSYEKDYMSKAQRELSYSVLLLTPPYLFEHEDFIINEFEKFIRELPWWNSS
ncbi:hypothetical protein ES703_34765 [subsurface metagenome]